MHILQCTNLHCSRINISIPLIYRAKVDMSMVRFNYNIFNCLYCVYIYKEVCSPIACAFAHFHLCQRPLQVHFMYEFLWKFWNLWNFQPDWCPIIIDFTPGKVLRWWNDWSWQVTRYPHFIKDTSPCILHIVPFPYVDQKHDDVVLFHVRLRPFARTARSKKQLKLKEPITKKS